MREGGGSRASGRERMKGAGLAGGKRWRRMQEENNPSHSFVYLHMQRATLIYELHFL